MVFCSLSVYEEPFLFYIKAKMIVQKEDSITVRDIQWNVEGRTMRIKDRTVALTTTEFRLLYPLRDGAPVTYASLASSVYCCSIDSKIRGMLDKHIDRVRNKIRGTGLYIYCVLNYGYMLFSENWLDEDA
jgi:DNA-binding response OmpR family regulator